MTLHSSRPPPPSHSTLFPYTTLFRSATRACSADRSAPCSTLRPDRALRCAWLIPFPGIELHLEARHLAPERIHLGDRKSTRLNSSHLVISYAVFCLKKKIRQVL